jgi:hypothetical protein
MQILKMAFKATLEGYFFLDSLVPQAFWPQPAATKHCQPLATPPGILSLPRDWQRG